MDKGVYYTSTKYWKLKKPYGLVLTELTEPIMLNSKHDGEGWGTNILQCRIFKIFIHITTETAMREMPLLIMFGWTECQDNKDVWSFFVY